MKAMPPKAAQDCRTPGRYRDYDAASAKKPLLRFIGKWPNSRHRLEACVHVLLRLIAFPQAQEV